MDQDYEYNAPKYVDFEASLCDNDASADAYFDQDHEKPKGLVLKQSSLKASSEVPKLSIEDANKSKDKGVSEENQSNDENEENQSANANHEASLSNVDAGDVPSESVESVESVESAESDPPKRGRTLRNIRQSWNSPGVVTMGMLKEAAKMKRSGTPERKALRQAVSKTIESVSNSPSLLLTKRLPHTGKRGSLIVPPKAGSSSRRLSGGFKTEKKSTSKHSLQSTTSNPQSRSIRQILKKELASQMKSSSTRGPLKATGFIKQTQMGDKPAFQPRGRAPERSKTARNSSCGPSISRGYSRERSREPVSKYVSTAEAIMNMQRCTPDRFRSLPQNTRMPLRSRSISPGTAAFRSTMPRSPQLRTKCRSRPTHVLSSQEQLDNEIKEMKKHQFKARAVGEGIKPSKLAQVEFRPGTVPQPFNLSETRTRGVSAEEIHLEAFKANPVPKNILQHPIGVPKKKTTPAVIPASPNFATKGRVKSRERLNKQSDSSESVNSIASCEPVFKARPAPHFGVPTTLPPQPKKATIVQPFSFDEKIIQVDLKKKEKINEILEREKKEREFKAHPLPNFDKPINLPIKEHIMPTKVEPFNLDIEKRVEARLKKWEEDIEEESKKEKEATKFKARPAKLGAPFVPAPSSKPLVEISNFELHTDRRAVERETFELQKKEKEVEILEYKRLREDQEKLKEEEEIRRLRKEAVHKSNPIRKYPPIIIHPSDKPVTEAKSPNFVCKKNSTHAAD